MPDGESLRVRGSGERWRIDGGWPAADLQLCNDYLAYLADRRYSPASVRAYAFGLLHFARWLAGEGQRPGGRVRPGHHQPAARGGLRPVQLPVDARPGRG